ncbi:MAG TPA: hypothetical protein H9671_12325 [Firmicutes bacterium]|nr:hypothetical protein [Bacillota bacterium]
MQHQEEIEFFLDQLFGKAVGAFQKTEQHRLLMEKTDQMRQDCGKFLEEKNKKFVFECFELITDVDGQEEIYVYDQAFKDCVCLLKWLGVLA